MKWWPGFLLLLALSTYGRAEVRVFWGEEAFLDAFQGVAIQPSGSDFAFRIFGEIPASIREEVLSLLAADDAGALSDLLLRESAPPRVMDAIFAEAVSQERASCVTALIELGVDAAMFDLQGMTALHFAAMRGAEELLACLLEQPGLVDVWDQSRMLTPLMAALLNGQEACAKQLIAAGANVKVEGSDGGTPLMICACRDALMEEILAAGAEVNQVSKRTGDTPLITAIRCDAKKMIHVLLEKGASVTEVNRSGESALSIALAKNDKALFERLRARGATIEEKTLQRVLASSNDTNILDFMRSCQLLPKSLWPALEYAIQAAPEGAANARMVQPLWNALDESQRDVAALQQFWLKKGAPRETIVAEIETCARSIGGGKPLVWKVVDLDFSDCERAFSRFRVLMNRRADLMLRNEKGYTLLDELKLNKSIPGYGTARYDRVVKRITQIYTEKRLTSGSSMVGIAKDSTAADVVGKTYRMLSLHVPNQKPAVIELKLSNPTTTMMHFDAQELVLKLANGEELVLPSVKLNAGPLGSDRMHFRLDDGEGEVVQMGVNFPKETKLAWAYSGSVSKKNVYVMETGDGIEIPYKKGCTAVAIEPDNVLDWRTK